MILVACKTQTNSTWHKKPGNAKSSLFFLPKVPSLWLNFLIVEPDDPPLVDLNDFRSWIIEENDDVLVLDKTGWLVCHPSKMGRFQVW